jgi:site-specific recombinase XerD
MENTQNLTKQNGSGIAAVKGLAERIAKESPGLADLNPEQLEAIARAVWLDDLKGDLKKRVDLARIDYPAERKTFLAAAGRTRSPHTRRAYRAALDALDAWAATRDLAVLGMKPRDADDYAYHLATEGRAPASVRRDLAAASSFFTWLERRHESIRNPFRGTKARPENRPKKPVAVPSADELGSILAELPARIRAAAVIMATRGLRVGALPSLSIRGERFTARSKGRGLAGELPPEALKALKALGAKPFADLTEAQIADAFRYVTAKLSKAGKLAARYSVHDLRHYYALGEYKARPDLYRLKGLLGHASIQVTEAYLRGLGEI